MVYKYTIDNILSLLQTVGTLTKEQIMRFFSCELADYRVEYLLNQLAIKHILVYDEEADTFSFVGAAHYRKETQAKLMKAFWVLVAAGSNNVQEIILTRFPTQFLFITPDGDTFDVTIVESEHDALLAQRIRSETILRGVSDIVTHIAILHRPEDVSMLKNAGFDYYCLIDPVTKDVKYVQLSAD